ncbi:MAG: OST-HTH/LOTUS domain-containing protein [Oscillospiraceae bacterium]
MRRLHPHRLPVQGRRKARRRRARRGARGQKARPQDEKGHTQHEEVRGRVCPATEPEPEPTPEPEPEPEPKKPDIREIHNLLHIASEKYQDADGFVNVSSSGLYIKRVKPDFNVRAYGYSKLPELLAAFPNKYQIKRYEGKGGATIIAYKCL